MRFFAAENAENFLVISPRRHGENRKIGSSNGGTDFVARVVAECLCGWSRETCEIFSPSRPFDLAQRRHREGREQRVSLATDPDSNSRFGLESVSEIASGC